MESRIDAGVLAIGNCTVGATANRDPKMKEMFAPISS